MPYPLPILVAVLIFYGSTYPFIFSPPPPQAFRTLLSDFGLFTSIGDVLGNIGLFIPWGASVTMVLEGKQRLPSTIAIALTLGFCLSLSAQITQLWVPARDPALADVIWNMVGCAIGIAAGWPLKARLSKASLDHDKTIAACLLLTWAFAEWVPLVPSLDLQLIKEHLKALADFQTLKVAEFAPHFAMALLAGHLFALLSPTRRSDLLLVFSLAILTVGKLFIHGARIDLSEVLGFACGAITWWFVARASREQQIPTILFALLAAYTLSALSPYALRGTPGSFVWLPFSAMLEGSLLANIQSILKDCLLFGGILYLVRASGGKPVVTSLVLAIWVLGMEMLQLFIETRTADITEPLLVLVLGQMIAFVPKARPVAHNRARHESIPALDRLSPKSPSHAIALRTAILQVVIALALITSLMVWILSHPGIPYNVRELFRDHGSWLSLLAFALALLWIGAGATWLEATLAKSSRPGLLVLPCTLAVSLISLTLLWSGVTTESVEDIAGSTNLVWFVINKGIWGDFWKSAFMQLSMPDFISLLERAARYSALYGPLPICLGYMLAWRKQRQSGTLTMRWFLHMTVGTLPVMWLCKAIAFDWASTDNLNELIARDGEWGFGGGGYLYALLLLICICSILLAEMPSVSKRQRILSGMAAILAVPIGWLLLNEGLEANVEKYGFIFSGAQFLLGPDRQRLLSEEILFLRWSFIQFGGILIIAVGIWLGRRFRAI